MRDRIELLRFYALHKNEKLALCTLVGKQGSTYRALGAKKLLTLDGQSCGLISGGCLEAEIEKKARENWDDLPFVCSFSTMNQEDIVFGYQSGCAGVIEILFEEIPLRCPDINLYIPFGQRQNAKGVVVSLQTHDLGARHYIEVEMSDNYGLYFDRWQKPIEFNVIGCGLDALPYYELAQSLGWTIRFFDYRPSFRGNLPPEADVTIAPLGMIFSHLITGAKSALLLMTHNYAADLSLLQDCVQSFEAEGFGYIGCLGPRERFESMKAELDMKVSENINKIIHAPPGLLQETHTPESIALSVVADIEQSLASQ